MDPNTAFRSPPFIGLTLFLLFSFASLNGQTQTTQPLSPDRIRLILLQGNEKTRDEIILREMKLRQGDTLDLEELQRDELRIQNLGIFNRVEIDVVPTNEGAILVVSVSEMWYIYPYPIIFRNERDWQRLSIGAGLLHMNFRGRREVIDFSGWVGFNPAVRLAYSNPWIFGKSRLYTRVSLFAKKVRNLSFTAVDSVVNENQLGFGWTIGKRYGLHTFVDASFGYRRVTLSEDAGGTLSDSGEDHLPHLGFSFRNDTRDLWEYPHRGHYITLWMRKTGLFGKTVDYFRYGADLRKYIPIGKTTLAFRTAGNLNAGTIPVYEKVHFGFATRIRGHFSDKRTGDNLMIASAEFRFPILPITYHDWGPFESMGRYGANLRFGISGGLFFDTGNIWFDDEFDLEDNISGWGAGLQFFLPYNGLIRVEYGFDEDWDGQIIVDALVAF